MRYQLFQVNPRVYVGRYPKEEAIPTLSAAAHAVGITAMVTVCKRRPPEELIERMQYWDHMPIPDTRVGEPPIPELRRIVSRVLQLQAFDHTVLVHCMEGRNRSMLVAALADKKLVGRTGEEEFAHVKEIRPNALNNQIFADWLRQLP